MFHHLLNLKSQTRYKGSPNNNGNDVPEVYERPAHKIGQIPAFLSGFPYSIY